jgi:ribosomal protein S18 acetylase RimI-like enzyme
MVKGTADVLRTEMEQASQGLRPVTLPRHMAGIAELIEMVFGGTLDESSRRMLRDMRSLGSLGWLGVIAARMLLPPAAHPRGFVWVHENRVVGNASLMPVEGCPERCVLANVAVHPDYRSQGIGRALVEASIEKARNLKCRLLILQVKPSNSEARVLYEKLGFSVMTTRTTWVRQKAPIQVDLSTARHARERRAGEWMDQWAMAQRMHPEGLIWPFPLRRDLFQAPRGEGDIPWEAPRHWVWGEEGRLQASLTAKRASDSSGWRLVLLVEHQARGKAERPLLAAALTKLRADQVSLLLDYPSGLAEAELRDHGFTIHNTLSWMFLTLGGG